MATILVTEKIKTIEFRSIELHQYNFPWELDIKVVLNEKFSSVKTPILLSRNLIAFPFTTSKSFKVILICP